jgi:hypothetical protein
MTRSRLVCDFNTGGQTVVPYTADEETAADADNAAWTIAQAPITADQQRVATLRLNARRQALITAIQNNDDAGLIAAAQARYPSLSGDAAKFVADMILLVAAVIRS